MLYCKPESVVVSEQWYIHQPLAGADNVLMLYYLDNANSAIISHIGQTY